MTQHGPTTNVVGFKLTNIAFHLCAGLAIFVLISRLLKQEFSIAQRKAEIFALVVMAIWLLHPIHVSTVLYVIQRMAILSALFTLLAFIGYLQFRLHYQEQRSIYAILSLVIGALCFVLAIFSKENALLLLPFITLCELFFFNSLLPLKLKKLGRYITYIIVLTSPFWLYATFDFWGQGYSFRDFTLADRLILQIAILGDYLHKMVLPTVGSLNLFDERFSSSSISVSNFAFVKGLVFSFGLIVLFIYSVYKKNRLIIFGLAWFGCFHLMESSFLPLEIYFEHRNYLPSIGIFIVLAALVDNIRKRVPSSVIPISLISCYLIYLCFSSLILSKTWGEPTSLFVKFVGDEPSSVRAKVNYAVYLENRHLPEFAMPLIEEAMVLRPDLLNLALNKLRIACQFDLNIDVNEHIEKIRKTSFFEVGALNQLKALIDLDVGSCAILSENPDLIEEILESVPSMKGAAHRHNVLANFFYYKSNYYAKNRKFEQAMNAIDNAIEYSPIVSLFLRKIDLLASAGLYEEALKTIELALNSDEQRRAFIPSRADEIKILKDSLLSRVNKGNL